MKNHFAIKREDARSGYGEDKIEVVHLFDRSIFVVADGAGGVSGGAATADVICKAVVDRGHQGVVADWAEWLAGLDRKIAKSGTPGLAAAIIAEVGSDGFVTGASVGDCQAWVFMDGEPRNLTSGQIRKPLLGEGKSSPVGFKAHVAQGTIVIATDGLWKYMTLDLIDLAVITNPLEKALDVLVDGVRLKNGTLQDDIAIVALEVK